MVGLTLALCALGLVMIRSRHYRHIRPRWFTSTPPNRESNGSDIRQPTSSDFACWIGADNVRAAPKASDIAETTEQICSVSIVCLWLTSSIFLLLCCFSSVGGEVTDASQNSYGDQVIPAAGDPCEHTIDCGDIVWGLAFGSSVPEKQSRCVNIEWHRFRFGQDQLLLATGLNNGRIKIWDVYTGEKHCPWL